MRSSLSPDIIFSNSILEIFVVTNLLGRKRMISLGGRERKEVE
jgi:hypothetical protein